MAVQRLQLNQSVVSMELSAVDRLLRMGSGDAALLYLYLLRREGQYDPQQAMQALRWNRARTDTAVAQLQELGLISGVAISDPILEPPTPDKAPEYTTEDIMAELQDKNSPFTDLVNHMEQRLGRRLSTSQMRDLLELFDHAGMPCEVLMLLIEWLDQHNKKKYGTNRKLSTSRIKQIGYRWKEQGYDTIEAVEEYLKNEAIKESAEGAILAALNIFGRKATATEARNIRQWINWGFPPETVAIAYDITVTNTGTMKWSYCSAVLRRWHEKNLHTPEQVQQEHAAQNAQKQSSPYRPGQTPTKSQEEQARENQQNYRQMQQLLAQMKKDD